MSFLICSGSDLKCSTSMVHPTIKLILKEVIKINNELKKRVNPTKLQATKNS